MRNLGLAVALVLATAACGDTSSDEVDGENVLALGSSPLGFAVQTRENGARGFGDLGSPCEKLKGKLYTYDPVVQARVALVDGASGKVLSVLKNTLPRAANASDPGGPKTQPRSGEWTGYACDTELHHCKIVFEGKVTMPAGNVRLELQAAAWTDDRSQAAVDVMELEADCDDGNDYHACTPLAKNDQTIETAGQLAVTSIAPGANIVSRTTTATALTRSIPIDTAGDRKPNGDNLHEYKTVLFSVPVKDFAKGDVVEATTAFGLENAAANHDDAGKPFAFNHFTAARMILTGSPTDTEPRGPGSRYVSSIDGKNCPYPQGCERDAVGAVQIGADAPAGKTMYLVVLGYAVQQAAGTAHVKNAFVKVTADAHGSAPHATVTCRSPAGSRTPCSVGP